MGVTAATRFAAGTHYDVSPLTAGRGRLRERQLDVRGGKLEQLFWLTLLPQLLIWPAFTVLVGMAGAAVAFALVPADVATAPEAVEAPAGTAARVDTSDAPSRDRPLRLIRLFQQTPTGSVSWCPGRRFPGTFASFSSSSPARKPALTI